MEYYIAQNQHTTAACKQTDLNNTEKMKTQEPIYYIIPV